METQNHPFSWRIYLLQNVTFLYQAAGALYMLLSDVNPTDFITKLCWSGQRRKFRANSAAQENRPSSRQVRPPSMKTNWYTLLRWTPGFISRWIYHLQQSPVSLLVLPSRERMEGESQKLWVWDTLKSTSLVCNELWQLLCLPDLDWVFPCGRKMVLHDPFLPKEGQEVERRRCILSLWCRKWGPSMGPPPFLLKHTLSYMLCI